MFRLRHAAKSTTDQAIIKAIQKQIKAGGRDPAVLFIASDGSRPVTANGCDGGVAFFVTRVSPYYEPLKLKK